MPAWRPPVPLICFSIAIVTVLTRAAAFGNPLYSGDDQLYLLIGKAMNAGAVPYVDVWDRKPIGLFLIFAGMDRLGGDGVIVSQIIAGVLVALTAGLIFLIARRFADARGSLFAALAFLICLPMFKGASAQAQLFYDPLIAGAALLTLREIERRDPRWWPSLAAMLLCGVAFTIKQTSVVESAAFGLMLTGEKWRASASGLRSAPFALALGAAFLLPTAATFVWFWNIGQLGTYWDTSFLSIFRKGHDAGGGVPAHLLYCTAFTAPLAALAWWGMRVQRRAGVPADDPAERFLLLWIAAAVIGVAVIPRFYRYYPIPLLVPLAASAASILAHRRVGPVALSLLAIIALAQGDVRRFGRTQQSREGFAALTAYVRANLHGGCLFVADGPPLLYASTAACRPTRFIFPDHLAIASETHGIPVDSGVEMRRIVAQRPSVIVVMVRAPDEPRNPVSWPVLRQALATDYRWTRTFELPIDYSRQKLTVWLRR